MTNEEKEALDHIMDAIPLPERRKDVLRKAIEALLKDVWRSGYEAGIEEYD